MKEIGLPFQHRVLIIAKSRQGVGDEMRQDLQGLRARGGKVKGEQITEVVPIARLHKVKHRLGLSIRRKAERLGELQPLLRGLAVVVVEIPFAPCGIVALHQQAGLAAHLAVEILHPQRLAPLGPIFEPFTAGDETVIRQEACRDRRMGQLVDQTPFPRLGRDYFARAGLLRPAEQLADERACVFGVIQPGIAQAPAVILQLAGKFAHCGEDKRDFLGVVTDIFRLLRDFGHDHHIARLVGLAQR